MCGVYHGLYQGTGKLVLMERRNKLGYRPRTPHTGGKLNKQLGSRLMYFVHKHLELLEHLRVLPKPFSPKGISQGSNSGNYKPYVVFCPLQKKLCRLLVKAAAGELKPSEQRRASHRAHNDSVFDLNITDFPRRK